MSEVAPLPNLENEDYIEEIIRNEIYKENKEVTSDENTSKLKAPPRKENKHMTLRKQKRKTRRQGEKPVWKVEKSENETITNSELNESRELNNDCVGYLHNNVPNLEEEIEIEMTERQMTESSEKAPDIVYDDQNIEGNECIASDRLLQLTNEARIFQGQHRRGPNTRTMVGQRASIRPRNIQGDITAIKTTYIKDGVERNIVLASVYMPYDSTSPPPSEQVRALVKHCEDHKLQLIIGADANAHNTVWGSTDTNTREIFFGSNREYYMTPKDRKPNMDFIARKPNPEEIHHYSFTRFQPLCQMV
ncbi:hypothetical protein JTB14_002612 [Gonioctena quinquepunctata]|nr:hypothetical protein JTB14_002612 [Gonioctena quinquepunctata]